MSDKILQIETSNALKAYDEAPAKFRPVLENLFGKKVFLKDVKERIKTFEDACESLGLSVPSFIEDKNDIDSKSIIAYQKLIIIARALNEGWKPDWSNSSDLKYFPWFTASGSGFSCFDYVDWSARTLVGSRLCFKSSELAEYAGKQFLEIYNDYITLN